MTPPSPAPSRRGLLVGSIGALALAACSTGATSTSTTRPSATPSPTGTATPTRTGVFCIAHRGGGKDWPEMTMYAYEQAAQLPGLTAMEVSVHRSRDGVLVCHHDADTERVTGVRKVIADTTWAELSTLRVSAKDTLDPSQPSRPLARFDELVDAWPRAMTMWVEPKSLDAVEPVRDLLIAHPDVRVVWKRPVNADFTEAHSRGWGTFGYVLAGEQQMVFLRGAAAQPYVQYFGTPTTVSDAVVREVVDIAHRAGRKAVMWPINNTIDRDRALVDGIDGLMCSDIRNLLVTS